MRAVDTILISELENINKTLLDKLKVLHIYTVQDLLFYLPNRYEDQTVIKTIGSLAPNDEAVVIAEVFDKNIMTSRKKSKILQVFLRDDTGSLTLNFFNFKPFQVSFFELGKKVYCFGKVKRGSRGLEMAHPEYREVKAEDEVKENIEPIYISTPSIQRQWIKLISQVLLLLQTEQAYIPEYLHGAYDLPYGSLQDALICLHQPPAYTKLTDLENYFHPAQHRLIIEELLAHHLNLRYLRQKFQKDPAFPLEHDNSLIDKFLNNLPFTLTNAQQRVLKDISQDAKQLYPMLRLVQGDVGSGKTVVAAVACLHAIACGHQAALMAPTELLAEQHYKNFAQWFEKLDIPVIWLGGKQKGRQKRESLAFIQQGVAMVIGTHALFQGKVEFTNLAVVVIDEQHRFGVNQRLALREKGLTTGKIPHQLMLTATPIPRTLRMIMHADLEVSIIDELPPGRLPIKTAVIPNIRRQDIIERIEHACQEGRQIYWVNTLIEESEAVQAQAAEKTAQALQEQLPNVRIALVHGRIKSQDKENIMQDFKAHKIDLLVATTVIEVGVDVPNASLMIIENAERLGLSQLHQLRGRVGRGSTQSSCVLLYQPPLSEKARERLYVMRNSQDGFEIAQKDLELRGPGEVLGTKQKGMVQFKVADISRDRKLFMDVQKIADKLELDEEIITKLRERWIPRSEDYIQT